MMIPEELIVSVPETDTDIDRIITMLNDRIAYLQTEYKRTLPDYWKNDCVGRSYSIHLDIIQAKKYELTFFRDFITKHLDRHYQCPQCGTNVWWNHEKPTPACFQCGYGTDENTIIPDPTPDDE
jgi:hypothetical protein